ncbi:MAG: hypothetical protein IPK37_19025 [Austwickia sp.]|jgi:hypothetical protein|nr:MAG: hypothetical protein IPK37_19025 [Austwickia sp.]
MDAEPTPSTRAADALVDDDMAVDTDIQNDGDAAAQPRAQVRREARLLAAALQDVLRRVEPVDGASGESTSSRQPSGPGEPGDRGEPGPQETADGTARAGASSGRGRAEASEPPHLHADAPRPDPAALSEILAGAGLVARGGMDLVGGLLSRLLAAGGSPQDPPATDDLDPAAEGDRLAAGPPRVVSYRRSPVRRIPVHDASEPTQLS